MTTSCGPVVSQSIINSGNSVSRLLGPNGKTFWLAGREL